MSKTFTQEEVFDLLHTIAFMGGSCHWTCEWGKFTTENKDWLSEDVIHKLEKNSGSPSREHTLARENFQLKERLLKLDGIIQAVEAYKK